MKCIYKLINLNHISKFPLDIFMWVMPYLQHSQMHTQTHADPKQIYTCTLAPIENQNKDRKFANRYPKLEGCQPMYQTADLLSGIFKRHKLFDICTKHVFERM